jgi:hypothetical protein
METYDSGQVKVQIVAGQARVQPEGGVEASDVRIEFYAPDGSLDGVAVTPQCRYDRSAGAATSDADVRIERGGLVVTGTGFDWNAQEQTVTIRSNAKVILPRNMRPLLPARGKEGLTAGGTAAGRSRLPETAEKTGKTE